MRPFDSDHVLPCLENEIIQPFAVINHQWFSSFLPLLCYLSLPFATEFPLVITEMTFLQHKAREMI